MFTFQKAKAATVSDILSQKQGFISKHIFNPNDGYWPGEMLKSDLNKIEYITDKIIKGLDWLNNLDGSLPKLTADLLTAIYNFLAKIILQTPLFIFNNPFLKNTSLTFALISITIVTILTVFESFMQMLNKKHTDFKTIVKRWAIVAGISGFMPFAFESGFTFINKLSEAISKIGNVNGGNVNGFIYGETLSFFDTLIIILFDLTAIGMLIPVCLQAGRRWWDLMCLAAISPLALSAWVFDRHKHYFYAWRRKVKSLSLVQLVYSVFILLMGVFIFATQGIQGGIFTLIVKLLIVAGGLVRMSNPPRFVTNQTKDPGDIKVKSTFKGMYDTITFKKFKPTEFIKGKMAEAKEHKLREKYGRRHLDLDQIEKELRKQHGKRYVKDLL